MNLRDKFFLIVLLCVAIVGCETIPSTPSVPETSYVPPENGGVTVEFVTDTTSVSGPGVLEISKVQNPGCKDSMAMEKITELKSAISFEGLRRPDIKERRSSTQLPKNSIVSLFFYYHYYDGTESERCTVPIAFAFIESVNYEIRFTFDRKGGKCFVTAHRAEGGNIAGTEIMPTIFPSICNGESR